MKQPGANVRLASRASPTPEELAALERLLQCCEIQSVRSGAPLPLGAHARGNGVNFAVFSRHATGVRLDLFQHAADAVPARSIILHESRNKTGDIWHVWLQGISPGQLYGFRFAGPYAPPRDIHEPGLERRLPAERGLRGWRALERSSSG